MNDDRKSRTQDLLDALAAAERYRAGEVPTEAELAVAPLLVDWVMMPMYGQADVPMLAGECTGHPELGTQWITTSPLIFIADDKSFARTRSRLYRLGKPHQDIEIEEME